MKADLLDDRLTALTAPEVTRAFREAYFQLFNADPSDDALAIFIAQSALETGRWKSIHWFNFGNIKAGETHEGFYTLFKCNEIINGKIRWFEPPHPQCRFRAYPTAIAGARDYLEFLSQRARFRPAWLAALRGSVEEFVDALKQGGYFTADLATYKRSVVLLYREFRKLIAEMGPASERPPRPEPVSTIEHSAMSSEDIGRLLPLVWDEEEFRASRDALIRDKDESA